MSGIASKKRAGVYTLKKETHNGVYTVRYGKYESKRSKKNRLAMEANKAASNNAKPLFKTNVKSVKQPIKNIPKTAVKLPAAIPSVRHVKQPIKRPVSRPVTKTLPKIVSKPYVRQPAVVNKGLKAAKPAVNRSTNKMIRPITKPTVKRASAPVTSYRIKDSKVLMNTNKPVTRLSLPKQ